MSCGCANRMRGILEKRDYKKWADGIWRKEGSQHEIPDDRIEEDHFRVLIETMVGDTYRDKVNRLLTKTKRIPT